MDLTQIVEQDRCEVSRKSEHINRSLLIHGEQGELLICPYRGTFTA